MMLFICVMFQGHYDLHQPLYLCGTCQRQWTPELKDLIRSGFWPASLNVSTLYTLDLLSSFQELKVISPGFARQAFVKLLEHHTNCGGREHLFVPNHIKKLYLHKQTPSQKCIILCIFLSGHISGDALQCSFLEFSFSSFEENQLCCGAEFTCPACTPAMLPVSADGNRKLYHVGQSGRCSFFQCFYWFIYIPVWLMHLSIYLSSSAVMTLPF